MTQKKILIIDDSALMRRVICDIIESDERFRVVARATNGLEALELLRRNQYDVVVLDINMPKMNGLQLLEKLREEKIRVRILVASTDTMEGAKLTMDALELGALDFIHKPDTAAGCRVDSFQKKFMQIFEVVAGSKLPEIESTEKIQESRQVTSKMVDIARRYSGRTPGTKVVAIASSTGGPKALQEVIPRLPAELDAPVLLVQHMPKGFTASLADRLNELSPIRVKEAQEGEEVVCGTVYVAMGGMHMNVRRVGSKCVIHYSDEPSREGVKPCANYMYESLADSRYDKIICVVMTGMGADGTAGIKNLETTRQIHVIAQNQETCTVYGMPKAVVTAGLSDQVVPLNQIAQEIILNVGVRT